MKFVETDKDIISYRVHGIGVWGHSMVHAQSNDDLWRTPKGKVELNMEKYVFVS